MPEIIIEKIEYVLFKSMYANRYFYIRKSFQNNDYSWFIGYKDKTTGRVFSTENFLPFNDAKKLEKEYQEWKKIQNEQSTTTESG